MKILIVEDDETIREGLKYCLEYEGYEVFLADCGTKALEYVSTSNLALLDINLPDINGFDLFKKIKEIKDLPVIFLTANDLETSIVYGLDMGADDYITKPFKTRELISRIKNALRKNNQNTDIIKINNVVIDMKQAKVFKDNVDVNLTALEYKILLTLALNPNTTFTREKLLADVWDVNEEYVYDNTLTVYIKRIREKVGEGIIETIRGIGYKIGDNNE